MELLFATFLCILQGTVHLFPTQSKSLRILLHFYFSSLVSTDFSQMLKLLIEADRKGCDFVLSYHSLMLLWSYHLVHHRSHLWIYHTISPVTRLGKTLEKFLRCKSHIVHNFRFLDINKLCLISPIFQLLSKGIRHASKYVHLLIEVRDNWRAIAKKTEELGRLVSQYTLGAFYVMRARLFYVGFTTRRHNSITSIAAFWQEWAGHKMHFAIKLCKLRPTTSRRGQQAVRVFPIRHFKRVEEVKVWSFSPLRMHIIRLIKC